MGTLANQFRDVVDRLRGEDIRIGVMALQMYRPFPTSHIAEALQPAKSVMVFEKGLSYGNQGALYADLKSALYPYPARPSLHNFITGLGGREIRTEDLYSAVKDVCTTDHQAAPEQIDTPQWIGLQL
jgi:pyruvate ferredoxin oxidoreductase alpha subunit